MSVLVIAPHPDDETLGCGGTLARNGHEGTELHWLIVTEMHREAGFDESRITARDGEIRSVERHFGFAGVHRLGYPAASLDTVPRSELVERIGGVVAEVSPNTIYVPYRGDVHSDHAVVFDAAVACTKRFRYPSVRRVRAYETLSETDFGVDPGTPAFRPNVFVDITDHLDAKLAALKLYAGEFRDHPFPRSPEGVRALAVTRGAVAGVAAAEAFMSLREIE